MSEFDLIDRLTRLSSAAPPVLTGIGDDAAITQHSGPTATSVDAVVDGVHFRSDRSSPRQIARKAIGTALSDIAAMAADPGEIYVTLGFPAGTDGDFLTRLAEGVAESAADFEVMLAGGDTVSSPVLFLSVTAVGRAPAGERLVLRSGAREGDLVGVTGEFGGAAAGLLLLEEVPDEAGAAADSPGAGSRQVREELKLRQLEPSPRIEAGRALRGCGVSAMIDISDGLAADLGHVARASGVAIEIDRRQVPVQDGVEAVASLVGRRGSDLALAGGEDYELAFTFAPGAREAVESRISPLSCGFTLIGEVTSGSGVSVLDGTHRQQPPAGFDHFS